MPEYSLDPLQDDCYENSTVLKNKFNIHDAKATIEIKFENVNFGFYKNLHRYIFYDIYEWAGMIRTVNMSKKGTKFCSADKIEERGQRIFNRLVNMNFLK